MSNIYKLCHTVDKENTNLYVFYGKQQSIIDKGIVLNDLFKSEPENKLFEGIFSEVELKDILDNTINVEFIDRYDKQQGGSVILKDGTAIPLSPAKKEQFFKLLETL